MPRQFPGTNFHDLNLDWIINQVKTMIAEWTVTRGEFADLEADWETEKTWFETYISEHYEDDLVAYMNQLVSSGQLLNIISPQVSTTAQATTTSWLNDNIAQETGYVLDKSLTTAGAAADAKAVGDVIKGVNTIIEKETGKVIGKWEALNYTTPAAGNAVQKGTNTAYVSCKLPVQYGDIIYFKASASTTGTLTRRYVITDSSNICLGVSGSPGSGDYIMQILYENAAYIYINNNTSSLADGYYAYKFSTVNEDVTAKQNKNVFEKYYDWSSIGTTSNPTGWQVNLYNDSGVTSSSSGTNYIRTNPTSFINFGDDIVEFTITVPIGYCVQISEYSGADEANFVRNIGDRDRRINTFTVTVPNGYYYRFCIGNFHGDGTTYAANTEFIATIVLSLKKSLETWQTEQDTRIATLENKQDAEIPSYYNADSYLQTKVDSITRIQNTINQKHDAFWFITDYHHQYNSGNSIPLLKYLRAKTGITKVMFGGDSGGSVGTTESARLHALQASAQDWDDLSHIGLEFNGVLGNHEWIASAYFNMSAMMGAYLNRFKTTAVAFDPISGNYYIDNIGNYIRYIFINDTASAAPVYNTMDWLYSVLMNVPENWSICVFMHHVWIPADVWSTETDGDYSPTYNYLNIKRVSVMLAGCRDHASVISGQYDFTSLTGTRHIIGVFGGHIHHGLLYTASDSVDTKDIITFVGSTDCLSASLTNVNGHPWYWLDGIVDGTKVERTSGTINEQCFYAVQVDLVAHQIHITAIGGDHDYSAYYET